MQDKHTRWDRVIKLAKKNAEEAVAIAMTEFNELSRKKTVFAYVEVKSHRPSTFFSRWCLKAGEGSYDSSRRMLTWMCPGRYHGNRIEIYKAGADAFAGTLRSYGVDASVIVSNF